MTQAANAKWASLGSDKQARLDKACANIAPSWPLDRLIAVNPLWEMRDKPIEEVSAQLAALAKITCLMPLDYYRDLYEQKKLSLASLEAAARERGIELRSASLLSFLSTPLSDARTFQTIAALIDSERSKRLISWHDELMFQISQFCAGYFQKMESSDRASEGSLYTEWLRVIRLDQGLSVLMAEPELLGLFRMLPETLEDLLALALSELRLDGDFLESYAHALLLDINGWASWLAYLDFHKPAGEQSGNAMLELLGIRLAWELVIWRQYKDRQTLNVKNLWENQKRLFPEISGRWKKAQLPLWIWSTAMEIEYQHQLHAQLLAARSPQLAPPPLLQAMFCIDVRSEPFRRALESHDEAIQTLGFAGFFGLPISFEPKDSQLSRPQLPGLIRPALSVEERKPDRLSRRALWRETSWENWAKGAPSAFFMIESAGWLYLGKLLKRSFTNTTSPHPVNRLSHQKEWIIRNGERELSLAERAQLAGGILRATGLNATAPWVLLIGHGSQTSNNPQAAALDCGACGGQTGEVNVRVLADLLNDPEIRRCLAEDGLTIAPSTRFVAALHNTTSDELEVFDSPLDPRVREWLASASALTRRERIPSIDPSLTHESPEKIARALKKRACDWSEVRPEWGLANNAAFMIAPRSWTRSLNLGGRCFLHDYDWQKDENLAILELLITAPMVVTHWINMQYNSSVTDNQKYGSGNKVLHNVVGRTIGVFEGNGGDLRNGLAMQSLHNGERWMHHPQRLSVYIAAPIEAISSIVLKHPSIRALVDNQWLYLFHWGESNITRIDSKTLQSKVFQ